MASKLIITLDEDLSALTPDELVTLNQKLGRQIDAIREYRRTVNAEYSRQSIQQSIIAKLTADERAALGIQDATVAVDPIVGELGAGE